MKSAKNGKEAAVMLDGLMSSAMVAKTYSDLLKAFFSGLTREVAEDMIARTSAKCEGMFDTTVHEKRTRFIISQAWEMYEFIKKETEDAYDKFVENVKARLEN